MGVPGSATDKVVTAVISRVATQTFNRALRDIANGYWTNGSNLLRMGNGFVRLLNLIGAVFTPAQFFSFVMSQLTFWEGLQFGTIGLAKIIATFATKGGAIAIRLATMGPAVINLVRRSVEVGTSC